MQPAVSKQNGPLIRLLVNGSERFSFEHKKWFSLYIGIPMCYTIIIYTQHYQYKRYCSVKQQPL